MIEVISFRTEGLGDSTYLLRFDHLAVLVDPQRDVDRFLQYLGGSQLRWVLETHLHNDYLSGGNTAARLTGAELVLPAAAAPVFRHTPAFHLEDLTAGPLMIRPLHTPGHTPEHTSYLVLVDGREEAVFSGGSLLVASSGRSDLLGPERADTLARLQYRSVHRLANLRDETALYPTHGAGSFCTSTEAGEVVSTIGQERRHSPVLAHPDEDSFVKAHLSGLQPYPRYYSRMGPANLVGVGSMPDTTPPKVAAAEVPPMATVVDARQPQQFAAGHLPGSLNIPMSDQFGVWFGWLVPAEADPYLVIDPPDVDEALTQLARIGIDTVAGLVDSPDPSTSATSQVGRLGRIPDRAQILDVRSPGEREILAPEGTLHRYLPDLVSGPLPGLDPARPVWTVCASGYRAAIASSLLRRLGFDAIPVIDGSIDEL